jgi:hypothetical protein
MLLNISYNDKKIQNTIEELAGKPFGLIDNIKLNGVGSPRLSIDKASDEIQGLMSYDNNINYCNIELRPKGIIIRFRSLLETYALVIPYYKLVIFKPGNQITFHIDQHYLTINALPKNKAVNLFVEKIISQKSDNEPTYVDDL